MRYRKQTYKPGRVLHFSRQAYTYETRWSSTKSRKIELQSYLIYIKAYLKKQISDEDIHNAECMEAVHIRR